MSACPACGDPDPPVEGLCWSCGHRRGWPVLRDEAPQDWLYTTDPLTLMAEELVDEDLIRAVEDPPL